MASIVADEDDERVFVLTGFFQRFDYLADAMVEVFDESHQFGPFCRDTRLPFPDAL